MKLTAQNVITIFQDCINIEENSATLTVEGVMMKANFDKSKLEKHKSNIESLLDGLSDDFKTEKGGGWTFLNMCNDKNNIQWADMHFTMDQLVCLGLAVEKLVFLAPRNLWNKLPGGMPYIAVRS